MNTRVATYGQPSQFNDGSWGRVDDSNRDGIVDGATGEINDQDSQQNVHRYRVQVEAVRSQVGVAGMNVKVSEVMRSGLNVQHLQPLANVNIATADGSVKHASSHDALEVQRDESIGAWTVRLPTGGRALVRELKATGHRPDHQQVSGIGLRVEGSCGNSVEAGSFDPTSQFLDVSGYVRFASKGTPQGVFVPYRAPQHAPRTEFGLIGDDKTRLLVSSQLESKVDASGQLASLTLRFQDEGVPYQTLVERQPEPHSWLITLTGPSPSRKTAVVASHDGDLQVLSAGHGLVTLGSSDPGHLLLGHLDAAGTLVTAVAFDKGDGTVTATESRAGGAEKVELTLRPKLESSWFDYGVSPFGIGP